MVGFRKLFHLFFALVSPSWVHLFFGLAWLGGYDLSWIPSGQDQHLCLRSGGLRRDSRGSILTAGQRILDFFLFWVEIKLGFPLYLQQLKVKFWQRGQQKASKDDRSRVDKFHVGFPFQEVVTRSFRIWGGPCHILVRERESFSLGPGQSSGLGEVWCVFARLLFLHTGTCRCWAG